jgi:hypothetical protein
MSADEKPNDGVFGTQADSSVETSDTCRPKLTYFFEVEGWVLRVF